MMAVYPVLFYCLVQPVNYLLETRVFDINNLSAVQTSSDDGEDEG